MDKATFVREVAQALREVEDTNNNSAGSNNDNSDDIIFATYRNFCYDDPIGITNLQHCRSLQRALLNVNSPYAISSRLIIGIQQCYQKYSNKIVNATTTASRSDNDNNSIPQELSLLRSDDVMQPKSDVTSSSDALNVTESVLSVLAQLLYCIHIQIPLQCCLSKTTLSQAIQYMGGYVDIIATTNPTATTVTQLPTEENPNHTAIVVEGPAMVTNGNHITNGNTHGPQDNHPPNHTNDVDNNSLEEVFAAESDDSDFEFESQDIPHNATVLQDHPDFTSWMTIMEQAYDPIHLSKPICSMETITWNHIATAMVQLISSVSYTTLTSILPIHWKQRNLSEPILQLCIALLIPSSSQHSPVLMTTPTTIHHSLNDTTSTTTSTTTNEQWQQQLGVRLINVFRDLTMYHINTIKVNLTSSTSTINDSFVIASEGSQNDAIISLLEDYLRLIRVLLQGDQPKSTSLEASLSSSALSLSSPAILVGLSSLSSLCSDVSVPQPEGINHSKRYAYYIERVVRTIQCTILDLCYELTDVLVQALAKSKEDLVAIQWAYLSLFQILTVPTSPKMTSHIHRTMDGNVNIMSNEYAQLLLNSGFFRQWLIVWSHLHQQLSDDVDNTTGSMAAQECILELCLVSPSLLGKYAWRFPSLSDIVLTSSNTIVTTGYDRSNVNELFWNLLGMYYATSTSSNKQSATPTIQWKQTTKNNPNTATKSTKSYQEQAWARFQSICTNTLRILTDWKIRREHNIDCLTDGTRSPSNSQLQTIVSDWNRVVTHLTTNPFLCQLFYEMIELQQPQQQLNGEPHLLRSNEQNETTVATTIQAEISPIQHLIAQCPISASMKASSEQASVDNHDNDDGNDKDQTVNKKVMHRKRMDIDQELKWVGALRKSMKVLLATIDTTMPTNGTQQPQSFHQNRVNASNKTD